MKIGFIGAGKMAGAIINGIISSQILKPSEIAVYDINQEVCDNYQTRGFHVSHTIGELVSDCKYVVLSVKPQNFTDIMSEVKPNAKAENVFVTIMAGISAQAIKTAVGFDAKVIRVMPNTPLLVGYGSIALSRVEPTAVEEFDFVKKVFESAGKVEEIAPDKMNEVIPLNGSSPAYIYLFAKVFVDRAVELGFDADAANRLFCNSLIGCAKMMMETGKSHQELIDMVTSKGGTTYAGLEALSRNHFDCALIECFDDTIKRAYELGK
mgnify:CR=1 FL=1